MPPFPHLLPGQKERAARASLGPKETVSSRGEADGIVNGEKGGPVWGLQKAMDGVHFGRKPDIYSGKFKGKEGKSILASFEE
jgi:hypothetical protein